MNLVRIWYKKFDRVSYISHLDMVRAMSRAMKRSGIPAWYTQGFNPHLYMTFPLPISLGFESECECMDIKLEEDYDISPIADKLNAVLPSGIRVYNVTLAKLHAEDIGYAGFHVSMVCPDSANEIFSAFDGIINRDTVMVSKKTKKGITEIDIKPLVEITDRGIASADEFQFDILLPAGEEGNINPSLFVNEVIKNCPEKEIIVSVIKTKVLDKQKNEFI